MRKMVIFVQKYARRWRARRVYTKRRWACGVIRTFVTGFINRNGEESEANAKFLQFVRYRFLLRLSQNLPNMILRHDRSWPDAPPTAKEASNLLCKVHRRHVVRKYIRELKPERKRQLEMKLFAHELFKGKKCSYEASVRNYFVDTRMSDELRNLSGGVLNNMRNAGETHVYSTSVKKYDRRGYKARDRVLVVSNKSLSLYDAKDMKIKLQLELHALQGTTITTMDDGLLIIRIPPEMKKLKGDLILECPNVIECVTRIIQQVGNKSLLKIEPPGEFVHQFNGGKQKIIEVRKSETDLQQFIAKSGHLIVMTSS
jgi:myosin-1